MIVRNTKLIGLDVFDTEEILINKIGYEPYIQLNALLAIKSKIDASIQFALNNDINDLNKQHIEDWYKQQEARPKRKEKKDKRTNIYLMVDHNTGFYKIGRSKSPLKREKTLQSEKPTIELIAHWESVESHENWLHQKFENKRIRGEWFALSQEDVDFILENIQVNI